MEEGSRRHVGSLGGLRAVFGVVTAVIAGGLAAIIALVVFGTTTLCQHIPPCPPSNRCIAIEIMGPCGVDVTHVVIAVLIGAAVSGATLGLMWRHFRAEAGALR